MPKLIEIKLEDAVELVPKNQHHRHPFQLLSEHKQLKSLQYGHTIANETDITDLAGLSQQVELNINADARIVGYLWDVLFWMTKLRTRDLEVQGPSSIVAINWDVLTALQSFKLENIVWSPFKSVDGSDVSTMTNLTNLQLCGPYSATLMHPFL